MFPQKGRSFRLQVGFRDVQGSRIFGCSLQRTAATPGHLKRIPSLNCLNPISIPTADDINPALPIIRPTP